MLDNLELEKIMEKLESMEDQQLAVKLLGQLDQKTKEFGKLLLNFDPNLSHDLWKKSCDKAKDDIQSIVSKIYK